MLGSMGVYTLESWSKLQIAWLPLSVGFKAFDKQDVWWQGVVAMSLCFLVHNYWSWIKQLFGLFWGSKSMLHDLLQCHGLNRIWNTRSMKEIQCCTSYVYVVFNVGSYVLPRASSSWEKNGSEHKGVRHRHCISSINSILGNSQSVWHAERAVGC